jgi:DNA uptake protein ComE-like DNA-binding protein
MKTLIREFLHFSRTEQKGIIVLAALTFLVIGMRIWIRLDSEVTFHIPPNEIIALKEMVKQMDQEDSMRVHEQNYPYEKKSELSISKAIDPNNMKENDWVKIGFTQKEASSIVKFQNKSRGFKFKEDLKKLYCMSDERFLSLEPFLNLPEKTDKTEQFTKNTKRQIPIIELNRCDSIALVSLRGIGPGWARRIIKRRDQLGGFYCLEQLIEMKGFSDTLLNTLRMQVKVDSSMIQKLNINQLSLEDLQKHPYCWYGVGKSIVNYRLQHGPFRTIEGLKKIYTLRPEIYEKLVHYVKLE